MVKGQLLFGCLALFVVGCKARDFNSKASSENQPVASVPNPCPSRFNGKLPPAVMKAYGNESAMRLNQTPWADWAGLLGSDGNSQPRQIFESLRDRAQEYDGLFSGMVRNITERMAKGDAKARGEIGLIIGLLSLDQQRVDLLRCNMWDTNGTADTYKAGDYGNRDRPKEWTTLQDPSANCTGDRVRFRTVDGKCNSVEAPLMGSTGQRFARNVSFAAAQKRGGIELDKPDPALISELLLTRRGDKSKYRPAPFFNGLAAAWIQFMTHDWFSHARRGVNDNSRKLTAGSKFSVPATLKDSSRTPVTSNPNNAPSATFQNQVSFWWDASQVYGSDESLAGAVRDPKNRALLLVDENNLLPRFKNVPGVGNVGLHPHELDQEVSGFPDNWWLGLSVLNTAFVREHNRFVKELAIKELGAPVEKLSAAKQEEAYQYGRLYISALIAKIHTVEWTTQLLFNPVLDAGMNANWYGIAAHRFGSDNKAVVRFKALAQNALKVIKDENKTALPFESNRLFAYGVAAPGITGSVTNHFGSPFTLPEEFTTVYRLHPLLPDQLHYRNAREILSGTAAANGYQSIDTVETVRGKSPNQLTKDTINNWMVSFGIQPTGTLTLHNYPRFLQKLEVPQNPSESRTLDLAAVDIMRDRERGVPRFNEFRRQIGMAPLKDMTDFINHELAYQVFTNCGVKEFKREMLKMETVKGLSCPAAQAEAKAELEYQVEQRDLLEKVYGSDKDGVERVDTLVGIFSENTRPHGFALAETQFQIFVLNASRRLFSDRFFSSDFNAKTYTQFGFDSLNKRGMRDVIADNFPELKPVMAKVCNAFDPWTRPRNGFSLATGFDPVNFHGQSCVSQH